MSDYTVQPCIERVGIAETAHFAMHDRACFLCGIFSELPIAYEREGEPEAPRPHRRDEAFYALRISGSGK